jgi:hypothetical protein
MSIPLERITEIEIADPRWKDLYKIGFFACIAIPVSIALAIIAYFIWPYTPGFTSVENIFVMLQNDRLAGLMSLDLMMLFIIPIMILHLLALYVALKSVNESYALIALIFGIIANILILVARPMREMVYLSNQYAAATTETAQAQYLAAGETFHAIFGGTAWLCWNIMTGVSYLVSCFLMLRSNVFSKGTAYVGIALFVVGSGIYIPMLAILSLVSTIASVVWFPMQARAFHRLGWGQSKAV